MSDSPRNNLVPIDDGLVRVAVLRKTVGLGEDLEVQELSKNSPAFSEDGSLNWLDRNRKRDGSFPLSLSDDESECDSNSGSDFLTLPAGTFPSSGKSKKGLPLIITLVVRSLRSATTIVFWVPFFTSHVLMYRGAIYLPPFPRVHGGCTGSSTSNITD